MIARSAVRRRKAVRSGAAARATTALRSLFWRSIDHVEAPAQPPRERQRRVGPLAREPVHLRDLGQALEERRVERRR